MKIQMDNIHAKTILFHYDRQHKDIQASDHFDMLLMESARPFVTAR